MLHRCCINCNNFAWWDGDYCCLKNNIILQVSPKGEFTEEILNTIKSPDSEVHYCPDYEITRDALGNLYEDAYIDFLEKYENNKNF